jgi:uncharacterized membrane protein
MCILALVVPAASSLRVKSGVITQMLRVNILMNWFSFSADFMGTSLQGVVVFIFSSS